MAQQMQTDDPFYQENYDVFPKVKAAENLVDINLDTEVDDTPTPKAEQIQISIQKSPPKKRKRRKSRAPYINMKLKNMTKLFDYEQIYFGCIAPLRSNHIDLHCKDVKDCDLHYCCGLFMKIDRSFTVHTILSTEFITSLKKIILKKEQTAKQLQQIQNESSVELKVDGPEFNAFHPRDHWTFAKDMEHKNAVIYIHGQNYAPNEMNAAEFVMDECMAFYADMPYLIIPFIWPCEGELFDYDTDIIAEEYCGTELAAFIRRMWSLFERIDFVAHGKGCNILLRAIKLLKVEKPDVIDMSHLILIAADLDVNTFLNDFTNEIHRFVKRITLYVNTWDWKLFSSKWFNWSNDRVGTVNYLDSDVFDVIDVTYLLSGWFLTSNHYYLTNKYFKLDVIQSLSKIGGVDPKYRNYVLPVYEDSIEDILLSNTKVKYYELMDKPYMKVVPDKKQNEKVKAQDIEEEDDDAKQEILETNEEEKGGEEEMKRDTDVVTKNLQGMGLVEKQSAEEEEEDDQKIEIVVDEESIKTNDHKKDDDLKTTLLNENV